MYSDSHNPKFIYIDIPRTASTSLRTIIRPCIQFGDKKKHITIMEYSGIDLDSYFKFTVVRNPWDRMVSFYHWWRQASSKKRLDKTHNFNSFNSFKEFVDYFYHNSADLLKLDDKTTVNNRRFWPMYEWIIDVNRNPRMDYILKFTAKRSVLIKACWYRLLPHFKFVALAVD